MFETVLLLVTAVWIIYEAIQRLFFKPVEVEASIWAFLVMVISIVVDISRSRILSDAAKKHNSQALEADALVGMAGFLAGMGCELQAAISATASSTT